MSHREVVDWLMQGDAAIRWQVMRGLMGCSIPEWEAEKNKVAIEGWGKQLLDFQDEAGTWAGGIYSPKWKSTTYTLLLLIDCGLPPENAGAQKAAALILNEGILRHLHEGTLDYTRGNDTCVWGFYLHICSYFGIQHPVLEQLADSLLDDQMNDGGWNCRKHRREGARHSSFHTTINVLEGLRAYARNDRYLEAETRAVELLLQHHLYKSDKTGEIINPAFTQISFPPRWHYDVLRGLDFIRQTPFAHDPRLADALELLESKRKAGMWPAQNFHAGKTFFRLEPYARQSRWNTLRALRVLCVCR